MLRRWSRESKQDQLQSAVRLAGLLGRCLGARRKRPPTNDVVHFSVGWHDWGMSRLDYQRTIVGYHGCDRAVAESVLLGRSKLQTSQNNYDWLGSGIYFWEYGPERALQWAQESSERHPERVKQPAVLGGLIHLGFCFDLLDVRFTDYLLELFPIFKEMIQEQGTPLPRNEGLPGNPKELVLRKLDCALLNWAIPVLEDQIGHKFHTVRGVFQEGEPAFEGSSIMRKSHIQVVARDTSAVLGYFRPEIIA